MYMLAHCPVFSCCYLLLALIAATCKAANEPSPWTPADGPPDTTYQTVDELRSFYKLADGPRSARKGAYCIVRDDASVELGPGARDLRINGVHIVLGRPLMRDTAGKLLISRDDWVYWIDPILRPTYIAGRAKLETVVIDAAHGGHDTGVACSVSHEAHITLQVAQALKKELEAAGLRCFLTRTGDYFLSDRQRVDLSNAIPNAIFVSLHLNSAQAKACGPAVYTTTPSPIGTETPRPGNAFSCRSAALAYALQYTLSAETRLPGDGCNHTHFSLLSSLTMPSVIVELGYASNPKEAAALTTPDYQAKIAAALARGIQNYSRATAPSAEIPVAPAPPQKTKPQPRKEPAKPAADKQKPVKPAADKQKNRSKNRPAKRDRTRR